MRSLLISMVLFLASACDQTPEKIYTPPVLTGTAYVLSSADHISVVDLDGQKLDRIKLASPAVDLETDQAALFILAASGQLGIMPFSDKKGGITWHKTVAKGVAMAPGKKGELLVLGAGELAVVSTTGKVLSTKTVPSATSIIYDNESGAIWLINRNNATAVQLDDSAIKVDNIGNSVHQGMKFPGRNELWVAEGNEYMNGEPYGVGFKKHGPAMPGGINVIDIQSGKMVDFIMVGGNVSDLLLSPDKTRIFAAVSRHPEYVDATMSVVGSETRRVQAELRLCLSCHDNQGVELERGQAEVSALAIRWPTGTNDVKPTVN